MKKCEICNQVISSKIASAKYCSNRCKSKSYRQRNKGRYRFVCKTCGKGFSSFTKTNHGKEISYCCLECKNTGHSKAMKGAGSNFWRGGLIERRCLCCGKMFYVKPCDIKNGGGKYCSYSCNNKSRAEIDDQCMAKMDSYTDKHARNKALYKNWRSGVLEKNNHTCQMCGTKEGRIVAHHMLPIDKYPREIYKLYNGVTLCHGCHRRTHTEINRDTKSIKALSNYLIMEAVK